MIQNRKSLLWAAIISVSIFCIILTFWMFLHLKRKETEFNNKKAILIKDNMNLSDKVDLLDRELIQRTKKIKELNKKTNDMKKTYDGKIATLQKQNTKISSKLKALENKSLVEKIRESIHKEENADLKKFLEKVLYNVVLIQSGKSIELEPIVVAKKEGDAETSESEIKLTEYISTVPEAPLVLKGKEGKVLSVDSKYSLIIIDLGRGSGIKEEQKCLIVRNEKQIASAKIISVRYKVSAAFVDDIEYGYDIRDIKEDDSVVVLE